MNGTERALLGRFIERRDSEAFREIVGLHQDMVYGTCRRILGNAADAEDAAQNCFLRFLRAPERAQGALGGWLHRVAVDASIDHLRQEKARKAREANAVKPDRAPRSPSWEEISGAVDQAINRLPEELRQPVVRYYLEGRKQEDVAQELGLTQAAVSKRLQRGVELLGAALRKGGWAGSVALLAAFLSSRTVEAAPASLVAALGKMALAGEAVRVIPIPDAAPEETATQTGGIVMKGTLAAVALAVVIAGGFVIHAALGRGPSQENPTVGLNAAPAVADAAASAQPAPMRPSAGAPVPAGQKPSASAAVPRYAVARSDMARLTKDVTQGALRLTQPDGGVVECPLEHTDVQAAITGFIARVKVTQTFRNPLDESIEAVYVFPLPHKSAVDDMTMVIGRRRIVGIIQRRAAAREIYQAALAQGATAALLEQERPNIFTQSVGNIPPKQVVQVEISYLDVLEYDMGTYEFHFPMVVGPRYIPGGATSTIPPVPPELQGKVGELDKAKVTEGPNPPKGTGWAPDTARVPDASRITPPVLKPQSRTGHDITLSLDLDAGVPIQNIQSANHKTTIAKTGATTAHGVLDPADTFPNKDFVLRYGVVGEKPAMAVLPYTDSNGGGYFMLMIQPKEDEQLKKSPPRELVFLVDVSGSMGGKPTEKVKEEMACLLELCKPEDTVQVITFESNARKLFTAPLPVTAESIANALNFMQRQQGGGGTEMLKGIQLAINEPRDPKRLRIVIMLTDGFIGNEAEIIAAVGKGCGDKIRFWCIGIGSSPNRFLTDGVAKQGGGMSKVLELGGNSSELAQEVMTRIHRAQLANIRVDWGDHKTFDTYPAKVPELWAGRPVVLFGRYEAGKGNSPIRIQGDVEGAPTSWSLDVNLPAAAPEHEVLAKIWARHRIEDLMQSTYYAGSPAVEEAVTQVALEYRLMSQYTSFVAVDESTARSLKEPARPPRRMLVPVPIPEGTRYEGFFGGAETSGPIRNDQPARTSIHVGGGANVMYFDGSVDSMESTYASREPVDTIFLAADAAINFEYKDAELRTLDEDGRNYSALRPASEPSPVLRSFKEAPLVPAEIINLDDLYAQGGDVLLAKQAGRIPLAEDGSALAKAAQQEIAAAEEMRKKGDASAARARLTWAYLLDSAARSAGASNGETAGKALAAIGEINRELAQSWKGMDKRLDLVIRDQSIPDALQAVAKAAGVPIEFAPGSIADAAAILGRKDLRIHWLDLRNATVAQALDWILLPNRMTWSVADGKILAGTTRRILSGESAWVYEVSMLAFPTEDELKDIKDPPKRLEAIKAALNQFRDAARADLKLADVNAVWYAPGQLLVFADAAAHQTATRLFDSLSKAGARMAGKFGPLQGQIQARAASRVPKAAEALDARERFETASALDRFSWQLLSASARGKLDDESLTELRIAWRRPEMAVILKKQPALALRACWALIETDHALPRAMKEPDELAVLARFTAPDACRAAAEEIVLSPKAPENVGDLLKVVYAELSFRGVKGWPSRERPALERKTPADPALAALYLVYDALLAPDGSAHAKALMEMLRNQSGRVRGDDLVVLTALACRRCGGDAWLAFRESSHDLLGRQPLSGSVITLVSSLSTARFPAVAQAAGQ